MSQRQLDCYQRQKPHCQTTLQCINDKDKTLPAFAVMAKPFSLDGSIPTLSAYRYPGERLSAQAAWESMLPNPQRHVSSHASLEAINYRIADA